MDYTHYDEDKSLSENLEENQKYVCGFLFDKYRNNVVVIQKNRPEWQKGLFNGVGGKIEYGETSLQAMQREFKEEAGLNIDDWTEFCIYENLNGETIHFFYSVAIDKVNVYSVTDEAISLMSIEHLFNKYYPVISSLRWLIPMALELLFFGKDFIYKVKEDEK